MLSLSRSGVVNSTVVNLMIKVLPYFLEDEIPDEAIKLAFCDLMIGRVCARQVLCISWSWWLLFFTVWRNTVFVIRVHSKIVRRFRNRKSLPWGTGRIADGIFRYTSVDFFFMDIPFWIGGTIQKKTVSTVIARHSPNHGHSKRHTTLFSIHPHIAFGWTRSAAHV